MNFDRLNEEVQSNECINLLPVMQLHVLGMFVDEMLFVFHQLVQVYLVFPYQHPMAEKKNQIFIFKIHLNKPEK
jgi:hypothetical protein